MNNITSNSSNIVITTGEKNALQRRLETLINETRPDAAKKLQEARELGDLSENQQYDQALKEISDIDAEIDSIREKLSNAQVVDSDQKAGIISMTDSVTVLFDEIDGKANTEMSFQIVGSVDANPIIGKFSAASPIGKAVLGLKKGDKFTYSSGKKQISGTIKEIFDRE
jgi:transcription elongation factor GreA